MVNLRLSEKDHGPQQYHLLIAAAELGPVPSNFQHGELCTEVEVFPPEPEGTGQTSPQAPAVNWSLWKCTYSRVHAHSHFDTSWFLQTDHSPCHHRFLLNVTITPLFCAPPVEPFLLPPSLSFNLHGQFCVHYFSWICAFCYAYTKHRNTTTTTP